MQWPVDTELQQMMVAAAPYGGPMAIVRDAKEFIKVGGSTLKPVIRIYTSSGVLLSTINVSIVKALKSLAKQAFSLIVVFL